MKITKVSISLVLSPDDFICSICREDILIHINSRLLNFALYPLGLVCTLYVTRLGTITIGKILINFL